MTSIHSSQVASDLMRLAVYLYAIIRESSFEKDFAYTRLWSPLRDLPFLLQSPNYWPGLECCLLGREKSP